jgi:hypothetical protein
VLTRGRFNDRNNLNSAAAPGRRDAVGVSNGGKVKDKRQGESLSDYFWRKVWECGAKGHDDRWCSHCDSAALGAELFEQWLVEQRLILTPADKARLLALAKCSLGGDKNAHELLAVAVRDALLPPKYADDSDIGTVILDS